MDKTKTKMNVVISSYTFTSGLLFVLLFLHGVCSACDDDDKSSTPNILLQDETVLKKMIAQADIAVKGLITNTYEHDGEAQEQNREGRTDAYIAEVWLLDVYKGGDVLTENMGLANKQQPSTGTSKYARDK